MSSLKLIKDHIKSIGNINKITSTMKVTAAAKFVRAEKNLWLAREMGEGALKLYEFKKNFIESIEEKSVMITVTSDRGLCGSVHSKICKFTTDLIDTTIINYEGLICIGEKSKLILQNQQKKLIVLVVNGIGQKPPSFLDASKIAVRIINSHEFKCGNIIFAKFKNLLSYNIGNVIIPSTTLISVAANEVDQILLQSFWEFSVALIIYYTMAENYTTELSNRITAMSNASKNAVTEMNKLQLEYNRKRQSAITTEIINIISGANSVTK